LHAVDELICLQVTPFGPFHGDDSFRWIAILKELIFYHIRP